METRRAIPRQYVHFFACIVFYCVCVCVHEQNTQESLPTSVCATGYRQRWFVLKGNFLFYFRGPAPVSADVTVSALSCAYVSCVCVSIATDKSTNEWNGMQRDVVPHLLPSRSLLCRGWSRSAALSLSASQLSPINLKTKCSGSSSDSVSSRV